MLRRPRPRRIGVEREPAREHLVGHHAERVDVAARVELLALELLRAHVRRRAEHRALLRELLLLLRVLASSALGDAEVEHLDEVAPRPRAVGQVDVRRLEIAVDDPLVVRLLERAADLPEDAVDALGRERAAASSAFSSALPVSSSIAM